MSFISAGKIPGRKVKAEPPTTTPRALSRAGVIDLAAQAARAGHGYKATLDGNGCGRRRRRDEPAARQTPRPLDEPGLVDMLRRRAKALSRARVYPVGALTVKLAGERLTEMSVLAHAGCVAFSQANVPITDTQVLWRAMQYAATFGFPVWLRAEDKWLSREGVAHDGEVATRLGLAGIPAFTETIALATLLLLVRSTGARLHVCRLSTAAAVDMIRAAKKEKLPVTCDVGIHYVHLSELDLGYFDSHCRLDPPLRSQRDREALAAGLATARSTVRVGPPPVDETRSSCRSPKPSPRDRPGAAAALALKWGAKELSLAQTLARVTSEPARISAWPRAHRNGRAADLVLSIGRARRVVPTRCAARARTLRSSLRAGRARARDGVAGSVVYEA